MPAKTSPINVKCPVCGRPVEWSPSYPFRPFCSERCKLIDLGAWAAEEHKISEDLDAAGDSDGGEEPPYH